MKTLFDIFFSRQEEQTSSFLYKSEFGVLFSEKKDYEVVEVTVSSSMMNQHQKVERSAEEYLLKTHPNIQVITPLHTAITKDLKTYERA